MPEEAPSHTRSRTHLPAAVRPAPDTPGGRSPAADLAFWGRAQPDLGRLSARSLLDRFRGDPRIGVVTLLVVALAAGLIWYRIGISASRPSTPRREPGARTVQRSAGTTRPSTRTTRSADLVVHVAGAVVRPGIVELAKGARVVDAIDAAGGARPDADLNALNLAAKVADGQRIAVGIPGQPVAVSGGTAGAGAAGAGSGSASGPLNLNTATQAEIEALPGIGPVLGAAILRERDQRGGFRSVDELRSVRGIGEKRFADLRALVTV